MDILHFIRFNRSTALYELGSSTTCGYMRILRLWALQVLRAGLTLDKFLWRRYTRHKKDLKKTYGSWVAVTGGTDGNGRAYCDELAKQGEQLAHKCRRAMRMPKS